MTFRMAAWAVGAVVFLGGCGDEPARCESNCPAVAGSYTLLEDFVHETCPWMSYDLGPTLVVEQTDSTGNIRTQLIDPVYQLQLPFAGELHVDEDRRENELGSFIFGTRTTRQATRTDPQIVTLEVRMTGSFGVDEGGRFISGQLLTTEIRGPNVGCMVTRTFVGVDRAAAEPVN